MPVRWSERSECGEVLRLVPVVVGPVTEAFRRAEFIPFLWSQRFKRNEFRSTKKRGEQAVDVRHSEPLLEELRVRWPRVVQRGQEERRDAERSVPAVASPLAALRTQLPQRHRHHGKRQVVTSLN